MNNQRLALIAAAAIAAIVILIFALRENTPPQPAMALPTPTPKPMAAQSHATPTEASESTPAPSPAPSAEPMAAWEIQIDNVLRTNVDETQAAQMLLNMLPSLPEDGQVEAANHVANLLPDEDYAKARPVLLNPNLPESVLGVLFTDLMNRPDPVKLRTFLDIAKIPNHPFHEEAASDLEIYLGEDYGTDWPKWNAALEKFLKASEATE